MKRCEHRPNVGHESLVPGDHEVPKHKQAGDLTNAELIEEIASAGYGTYEMADCPCWLNSLRREALARMSTRPRYE
jgi:hypothetical protein